MHYNSIKAGGSFAVIVKAEVLLVIISKLLMMMMMMMVMVMVMIMIMIMMVMVMMMMMMDNDKELSHGPVWLL